MEADAKAHDVCHDFDVRARFGMGHESPRSVYSTISNDQRV